MKAHGGSKGSGEKRTQLHRAGPSDVEYSAKATRMMHEFPLTSDSQGS